ncbi:hypothetical protein [Paractinoplanes rishiriensis]|uniref:Uncharacterized protein n=1 Tax=Paractinoplanes rishiriensis TaxID=1050105 RepID=A0A919K9P4_9ACTN|nr:hypothetical protein [Actinoplanes rishiriensis]GIF02003.1 hypothetical protein Ari01nite_94670 [Actinoplanes rishiriensis]
MGKHEAPEPKRPLRHRLTQRAMHPIVHVAALVALHSAALLVIAGLEKTPLPLLLH